MKTKNKKICIKFLFLVLALLIIILIYSLITQNPNLSDNEIIQLLERNEDAKFYMNRNLDFHIINKTILTKDSILAGREKLFKELYEDLILEDNRYLKVDLMDSKTNQGLFSIIDLTNKTVVKAYGLILAG